MKSRLIIGLLFLLVISCYQQREKASSLLDFIPQNAAIIVKINNLNGFKSDLKNNDFLSKLELFGVYKSVIDEIEHLDLLKSETESLLSFSELGAGNFEFTLVTNDSGSTFASDSSQNIKKESVSIEGQSIGKYNIEGDILYSLSLNGKLIISSSEVIIENLTKNPGPTKTSALLKKLYGIANPAKNASLFINPEKSGPLFKKLLNQDSEVAISDFSDWILLDVNTDQNHLNFNGISVVRDSAKKLFGSLSEHQSLGKQNTSVCPRFFRCHIVLYF